MDEEKTKFKTLTPEEQNALNEQTKAQPASLVTRFFRILGANVDQFGKILILLCALFFSYFFLKIKLGMTAAEIRIFWDDWLYLFVTSIATVSAMVGTSYIPQGRLSKSLSTSVAKESDEYGRSINGKQK